LPENRDQEFLSERPGSRSSGNDLPLGALLKGWRVSSERITWGNLKGTDRRNACILKN